MGPATPPPLHPGVARIRSDGGTWDGRGKGKGRDESVVVHAGSTPGSSAAAIPSSLAAPGSSSGGATSVQSINAMGDGSLSTNARRVGMLGIPLSSDSDDEEDIDPMSGQSSGSLVPHAPGSPAFLDAPEATYSRGGSTRSGPSTRAGEGTDSAAFVSEESFRDIVDELTRQNQQLKAKLKRYESARVPSALRQERLFEIRWHEGLPKNRRREIESFLTGYVQTLSSTASSSSHNLLRGDGPSTSNEQTESTSSVGATLRSLRSSEKELMAEQAQKGKTRSASGSGSGSGSKRSREKEPVRSRGAGPTESPFSGPSTLLDPPALLRRPTDIFPPERDVLAAPSFSGAEPRSLTGTGNGMRISDPASKRRKRKRSPDFHPAGDLPERPPAPRRSASAEDLVLEPGITDPEKLEALVVEMVERLFSESLPVEGEEDIEPPPDNPLLSDPYPLPHQSSTNTQYLRTLLQSEETKAHGGWLYLNLIATFAALHRLNISVGTVRHALRTRSELIEVSEEGTKVRWTGPAVKAARKAEDPPEIAFSMGGMEGNDVEATQMQVDGAEGGVEDAGGTSNSSGRSMLRSGRRAGQSLLDPSKGSSGDSTAPTSQHPSNSHSNSKNADSSHGTQGGEAEVSGSHSSREQAGALPQSNLRNSVEEAASPPPPSASTHEVLGAAVPPTKPKHLYTPLIFQTARSPSEGGRSTDETDSILSTGADGSDGRPAKRRKGFEGGVVFFANDLFFSDLAGDSSERVQLLQQLQLENASASAPVLAVLGENSSTVGATGSTSSGLRSGTPASGDGMSESVLPASTMSRSLGEADSMVVDVDDDASSGIVSLDGEEGWNSLPHVQIVKGTREPPSRDDDLVLAPPHPRLQVSGTSEVTAADHFTLFVKHLYFFSASLQPSHPHSSPSFASSAFKDKSAWQRPSRTFPSPAFRSSRTIQHNPSICPRFPRFRMRLSSTASDSDADVDPPVPSTSGGSFSPTSSQIRRLDQLFPAGGPGGAGDYLMSLALPLNTWAPETRRQADSDEWASGPINEMD
ncbi:hypothetical protein JCM10207_009051 [Rhodosporidiobolus poonsookiae]